MWLGLVLYPSGISFELKMAWLGFIFMAKPLGYLRGRRIHRALKHLLVK
jgi:hypothetical protein